jgi:hypothetical protein
MELSHPELVELYDNFIPEEVKEGVNQFFEQDIDNADYWYDSECIWITDQKLGGMGAYAMPSSPTKNPFPGGEQRSLYRPLQYARSSIDICDVRLFARNVIENSGMHLEAVCRKYIDNRPEFMKRFVPKQTTLGKATSIIEKNSSIDRKYVDAMYQFVKIYNLSKHEINQDESRVRMFNAKDAIVSYFVVRIIGLYFLGLLDVSESKKSYEIIE